MCLQKLCHEYSEKDPTPENFSQLLDDITRVLSLEDRVKEKVKAIGLVSHPPTLYTLSVDWLAPS